MQLYIGPAGNCAATAGKGTEASFAHLKSLGLNGQELEFVQSVYMTREAAAAAGEASRANGIHVSIHAPYFINLCSTDAAKIAASKKRISDSLDRATILKASGPVAVHPGFFQGRDKQECFNDVLANVVDLARQHPNALLGLETTGKHTAFGSFNEVLEVCKASKLDNVVAVVDFAHLYARNNGRIDFNSVLDEFLSYGRRELYAHYSSINYSEKGELNHLPLMDNKPPFSEFIAAVKSREKKFTKVAIVCETPLLEEDAVRMKQMAQDAGFALSRN